MIENFKESSAHTRNNGCGNDKVVTVKMDELKERLNEILTGKIENNEAINLVAVSHLETINAHRLHQKEIAEIRSALSDNVKNGKISVRIIISTIFVACSLVIGMIWNYSNRLEQARTDMLQMSHKWEMKVASWDYAIKKQIEAGNIKYEDFFRDAK